MIENAEFEFRATPSVRRSKTGFAKLIAAKIIKQKNSKWLPVIESISNNRLNKFQSFPVIS